MKAFGPITSPLDHFSYSYTLFDLQESILTGYMNKSSLFYLVFLSLPSVSSLAGMIK